MLLRAETHACTLVHKVSAGYIWLGARGRTLVKLQNQLVSQTRRLCWVPAPPVAASSWATIAMCDFRNTDEQHAGCADLLCPVSTSARSSRGLVAVIQAFGSRDDSSITSDEARPYCWTKPPEEGSDASESCVQRQQLATCQNRGDAICPSGQTSQAKQSRHVLDDKVYFLASSASASAFFRCMHWYSIFATLASACRTIPI